MKNVVIVGGNECMERQYIDLCKEHGCRAKVFCKFKGGMKCQLGKPDLLILFTHTVSHKMVKCALANICDGTCVIRSHSSSMASLGEILKEHVA